MAANETNWINDLIADAARGRDNSHSPYSEFRVGAAVLCEDGTVYTGCNVENACFPVGVCAERTAIGKAVSEGHKKFKAIAVITDVDDIITPCGMCRQCLREFMLTDIYCARSRPVNGRYEFTKFSLDELLPHSFGPNNLLQPRM